MVSKDNPAFRTAGNSICRFEFFEAIVRVAQYRFLDSKECETYKEAVKKCITEFIQKNC